MIESGSERGPPYPEESLLFAMGILAMGIALFTFGCAVAINIGYSGHDVKKIVAWV